MVSSVNIMEYLQKFRLFVQGPQPCPPKAGDARATVGARTGEQQDTAQRKSVARADQKAGEPAFG